MELRRPLRELTPAETRARAREYHSMAQTARTADIRDALLLLAQQMERRAAEKDAEPIDGLA
jgi:hypothetical protein